ncbi:MAG: phage antirepressor KilAC domain-containing protein [Solobacterium sp.]|nr:phage antirepressor KilAC domain-containing protein [Solobacterium sp.]
MNTTDSERITVSARELHKALEVNTDFNHWFTRMCEYGFEDGKDFATFLSESTGGRPSQDAQITVDMAKEIAMLQRTEKGKEVRKYFIQIEKEWNSPERVMARALTIANKTIATLEIENKEMKPKALFADAVAASNSNILIGDLAKLIKQNGHDIGQKRLFDWLRDNGYLIKYGSSRNMPTHVAMNLGLFKVKESTFSNPDGSVRITRTTKVTGKGQQYFINKFLGS